uniref:Putative secreted protein n=1 Tax=Ixodes ricinus TaxID=34613 RepID=A0A6B0U182_IXORI
MALHTRKLILVATLCFTGHVGCTFNWTSSRAAKTPVCATQLVKQGSFFVTRTVQPLLKAVAGNEKQICLACR